MGTELHPGPATGDRLLGQRHGPYAEHVSADVAGRLWGQVGVPHDVLFAPPAIFPVLFGRALQHALSGVPDTAELITQELELHAELPVDTDVQLTTWVSDERVSRSRREIVLEFDVRGDGRAIATGRQRMLWPAEPSGAAPSDAELPTVHETITDDAVDVYAELARGAVRRRADAPTTASQVTAAHGALALQTLFRALTEGLGVDALPAGTEVSATQRAPVQVGDTIAATVQAPGADGRRLAACVNQDGVTVLAATVLLPRATR
ncbi:MAG: hypothetical protein JWR63_2932 [Conexibacter sp.]|nr:hypothetical protein [Conexibacter sp.]